MHSTFINGLCFQKKLAISSLPFHQKKILADYLFAELQTILSEVLILVILLFCDPIVIVVRAILVRDLTYKLCSSAIQSAFFFSVAVVPEDLLQSWWFQNSSFIFQTCCSIYLDKLHMACLYSLVFLQEVPPARMWSVRKLGRTVIKMALEAGFCVHVNPILTGWNSVTER